MGEQNKQIKPKSSKGRHSKYAALVVRGNTMKTSRYYKVILLNSGPGEIKRLKLTDIDVKNPGITSTLKKYNEKYPEKEGYPTLSLEGVSDAKIALSDDNLRPRLGIISVAYILILCALVLLYHKFVVSLFVLKEIYVTILVSTIMLSVFRF